MVSAPSAGSEAGRWGSACVGGVLISVAAWLTWRNLSLSTHDGFIFWVPISVWLLTMGVLCLWRAMSDREASQAIMQACWRAGWIVGGAGLAIGVLGPLVVHPKANLGPLLGILVTGPVGFVVGALVTGLLRAARTSR